MCNQVSSRFSFNGMTNPKFKSDDFSLEVQGGIGVFKSQRPVVTLLSAGGVERNAIIGDDAEKRQSEIPIVMLNPGGILNYKYDGEIALRDSGLPYSIVRSTGNQFQTNGASDTPRQMLLQYLS